MQTLFALLIGLAIILYVLQSCWPVLLLCTALFLIYQWSEHNARQKAVGKRTELLRAAKIDDVDQMSGQEFERHLAVYFGDLGFKVETTPGSADYGADLILRSETECIVVQAKRWNSNVGVAAVQEVSTARHYYNADSALLVTNSTLTKNATALAVRAQVTVWDRNCLIQKLAEAAARAAVKHSVISDRQS